MPPRPSRAAAPSARSAPIGAAGLRRRSRSTAAPPTRRSRSSTWRAAATAFPPPRAALGWQSPPAISAAATTRETRRGASVELAGRSPRDATIMVLVREPGRPRWHVTSVTRASPAGRWETAAYIPTYARRGTYQLRARAAGDPTRGIPAGDQPTDRHQGPVAMAEPLTQHQPATATADTGGRLAIDVDGGLVRLRARYDPELVAQLRTLPGRRFIRARREWVLPAKREALAQLASLVEQLGDAATPTERARRRLERARPGRVDSREGEFELCFPYNARLLERVRSIPERSYRRDRRRWTVPPTRAGALALLALLERGEFTADPEVAARLTRLAAAHESRRLHGRRHRERPAPRAAGPPLASRHARADLRRQPTPTPMGRRDRLVRARARRPRTPPRRPAMRRLVAQPLRVTAVHAGGRQPDGAASAIARSLTHPGGKPATAWRTGRARNRRPHGRAAARRRRASRRCKVRARRARERLERVERGSR